VKKISSFTASPHVNHISLLTVTSGSEGNQHAVQMARLPLHAAATALYLALAAWAAFKKPPHVAALLGILMMPVLMYPANYYIHFVFLLPLIVSEPLAPRASRFLREADGKVWMLVLGLCAAQYFTVRETALDMHFYNASVLLMVATLGILIFLLPRSEEGLILIPFVDTKSRDALLTFGRGEAAEPLAVAAPSAEAGEPSDSGAEEGSGAEGAAGEDSGAEGSAGEDSGAEGSAEEDAAASEERREPLERSDPSSNPEKDKAE
jgi:hypothetical protein